MESEDLKFLANLTVDLTATKTNFYSFCKNETQNLNKLLEWFHVIMVCKR